MSVVPMKKARLLLHRDDVAAALRVTQSVGAIEFTNDTETTKTAEDIPDTSIPHEALLPRVEQVVQFLSSHQPPVGLWHSLMHGVGVSIPETEVVAYQDKVIEHEPTVTAAEQLHVQATELREHVRTLEARIAWLQDWADLPLSFSALKTAQTVTHLVERTALTAAGRGSEETLADMLREHIAERECVAAVHEVRPDACAVTVMAETAHQTVLDSIVKECQAEYVEVPPVSGTVASAREEAVAELDTARAKETQLHHEIAAFAQQHLSELQIAADVMRWQQERHAVLAAAIPTEETVTLDGWLNANAEESLVAALDRSGVLYALETRAPEADEEPPVEIENHPLMRPFEVVTRLYGLPGHRDLDPTVFLAGFFFLFFGLSLTDVGYGIFLMTAALLLLFVFHVSKTVRLFGSLLLLMGASSTLVGMLFGGYLGVDPETLPAALQAIQQFDPINDPLPVFYLALGLGVVQVMFGMVLKIVSDARNGRLLDGVLDQVPWLALFVSAIFYGAATTGYALAMYEEQFLLCIYASLAAIVIASGRKGETLLQKVQASLLSVYQSIGYFSDILSYSRLLALGLATTALAFAVNLIADIVRDAVPYLGFVLALVVLIIGHAFTLAVNTLGAFIHSARLQFVEFFGKFITGTGRTFKPLSRRESYVTVTDTPADQAESSS